MVSSEQRILAVLAHLSYLLGGIGFVLVPLGLMIWKKEDAFVHDHARNALCMHLLMIVITALTVVLSFLLIGVFLMPVVALVALLWFFASLYASWKAVGGEDYMYPLTGWLVEKFL